MRGRIAQRRFIVRRLPMKMTASTRLVGGVTIVDLSGRIVLGEGSAGLRDLVRNLVSEGNKKILLNLHDVNYIDSSGLGELVSAFTSMRKQGGELKLLNLTKRVHDLLQITKLYAFFDITDDEAASVKSFSPAIWSSPLLEPIVR
jgi:anti-sigma B factor antagonist